MPIELKYQQEPIEVRVPITLDFALAQNAEITRPEFLVGREVLVRRLVKLLSETRDERACFLVVGYRGAGKTNLVRRVTDRYEKFNRHLWPLPCLDAKNLKKLYDRQVRLEEKARKKANGNAASIKDADSDGAAKWHKRRVAIQKWYARWRQSRANPIEYFTVRLHRLFRPRFMEIRLNLSKDNVDPRMLMFEILDLLQDQTSRLVRGTNRLLLVVSLYPLLAIFEWFLSYLFVYFPPEIRPLYSPTYETLTRFLLGIDGLRVPESLWQTVLLAVTVPMSAFLLWWSSAISSINRRLTLLRKRIVDTLETEHDVGVKGWRRLRRTIERPMEKSEAELEIIKLLAYNRSIVFRRKLDVVVVIDELDKVSPDQEDITDGHAPEKRLEKVESVLADLKYLLTIAKARFLVIAGRDMLDRYQAERRTTSSLYESIFDQYFEVPSLLTDTLSTRTPGFATMTEVFVCRRILPMQTAQAIWIERELGVYENRVQSDQKFASANPCRFEYLADLAKKLNDPRLEYEPYRLAIVREYLKRKESTSKLEVDNEKLDSTAIHTVDNETLMLRHFVHYLTFYSTGNCKKLQSVFQSFVRPVDPSLMSWELVFTHRQIRRLMLGSALFSAFHHHLGHHLRVGGDKLAVSTLTAFHHILKFHAGPFDRHHLENTLLLAGETRAPELGHTLDVLLTSVMRSLLHKVRGNLYRHRFLYAFEQELRYIARTNDLEAATYNVSLSSMSELRQRFLDTLDESHELYGNVGVKAPEKGVIIIAELNTSIAETLVLEQRFADAERYFEAACDALRRAFRKTRGKAQLIIPLIEAQLKLGLLQERRLRFPRAAASYDAATKLASRLVRRGCRADGVSRAQLLLKNEKRSYSFLTLPFVASVFLSMKRGLFSDAETAELMLKPVPQYLERNALFWYQIGDAYYYGGLHNCARLSYSRAIDLTFERSGRLSKSQAITVGNASMAAAECICLEWLNGPNKSCSADKLNNKWSKWVSAASNRGADDILEQLRVQLPPRDLWANLKEGACNPGLLGTDDSGGAIRVMTDLFCATATQFRRNGRPLNAGAAYLRIASMHIMFYQLLSLVRGNEQTSDQVYKCWLSVKPAVAHWLSEAHTCFANADTRAATRFRETAVARDLKSSQEIDDTNSLAHSSQFSLSRIIHGIESAGTSNPDAKADYCLRMKSQLVWHDSLHGQLTTWTKIWADVTARELGGGKNVQDIAYLDELEKHTVAPFATKTLILAKWLIGRLYVSRLLRERDGDPNQAEQSYLTGFHAVKNLYSAIRHTELMAMNDQGFMFPPLALLFFDLWRTLYVLVECEVPDTCEARTPELYTDSVVKVRQMILNYEYLKPGTPAGFFDLRFVRDRLNGGLTDLETMADSTSRATESGFRRRFFLAADFQDAQFHGDWTLAQMVAPFAPLLRARVERDTKRLQGKPTDTASETGGAEKIASVWN